MNRQVLDYKILDAKSLNMLSALVKNLMEEKPKGSPDSKWEPLGGVSCSSETQFETRYVQAMALYTRMDNG